MDLSEDQRHELNVALNEATLIGAEVDPQRRTASLTLAVLTLPPDDGPPPVDDRVHGSTSFWFSLPSTRRSRSTTSRLVACAGGTGSTPTIRERRGMESPRWPETAEPRDRNRPLRVDLATRVEDRRRRVDLRVGQCSLQLMVEVHRSSRK